MTANQDIGDQPWGFWVIIRNAASAEYAIKMSGLVIFILGFSTAITCAMIALASFGFRETPNVTLSIWQSFSATTIAILLGGLVLMLAGLKLRAGSKNVHWLFVATPFVLLNFALLVALGQGPGAIIYALQIILLISGFRGLWWLKRKPHQGSS